MGAIDRKFQLPFDFDSSGVARTVGKDSAADIDGCVEAILRTPLGSRLERPTFGVPDMTFRTNGPDPVPVREAIERDEPRARFAIAADESDLAAMIGRIQVTMDRPTGGAT